MHMSARADVQQAWLGWETEKRRQIYPLVCGVFIYSSPATGANDLSKLVRQVPTREPGIPAKRCKGGASRARSGAAVALRGVSLAADGKMVDRPLILRVQQIMEEASFKD